MGDLQAFDLNSLKRMTIDKLITKCRQYVGQYLSKSEADRFDIAYETSRFDQVKYILENTLKRIKIQD